jgi:hypothetical protein
MLCCKDGEEMQTTERKETMKGYNSGREYCVIRAKAKSTTITMQAKVGTEVKESHFTYQHR